MGQAFRNHEGLEAAIWRGGMAVSAAKETVLRTRALLLEIKTRKDGSQLGVGRIFYALKHTPFGIRSWMSMWAASFPISAAA
jgi:hypothetical protein